MARALRLELLLALLGTSAAAPIDGATVCRRLATAGHDAAASKVLVLLLELEASGHLHIDRRHGHRFGLTPLGEAAAYELGPGDAIEVVLMMVDLVGFVRFTAEHGDIAAHHAARQLQDLGEAELGRAGGTLVKHLGDGFLGTVRTSTEGVEIARRVAQRCVRPDGQHWAMRAAVHRGRPIAFRGDLFGADVNLTARLCAAARPDELVMTVAGNAASAESLDVRGLSSPVAVTRVMLS